MDMKCEGCVNAVKNKLHEINGKCFVKCLDQLVSLIFCLQRVWNHE